MIQLQLQLPVQTGGARGKGGGGSSGHRQAAAKVRPRPHIAGIAAHGQPRKQAQTLGTKPCCDVQSRVKQSSIEYRAE